LNCEICELILSAP